MKPLNYRISPLFKNVFSFEGCCTEKNRKYIRKKKGANVPRILKNNFIICFLYDRILFFKEAI